MTRSGGFTVLSNGCIITRHWKHRSGVIMIGGAGDFRQRVDNRRAERGARRLSARSGSGGKLISGSDEMVGSRIEIVM